MIAGMIPEGMNPSHEALMDAAWEKGGEMFRLGLPIPRNGTTVELLGREYRLTRNGQMMQTARAGWKAASRHG